MTAQFDLYVAELRALAVNLDAVELAVARRLGARLERSLALRLAVAARAGREGGALVSWADAQGAQLATYTADRVLGWRIFDGLEFAGKHARVTLSLAD